jgi:hypothetical protein
VRWALTFKEIRLLAHFSVLKVMPDNKLNIPVILTKFSQTEPAIEEEAVLPSALVSNLQVEGRRAWQKIKLHMRINKKSLS